MSDAPSPRGPLGEDARRIRRAALVRRRRRRRMMASAGLGLLVIGGGAVAITTMGGGSDAAPSAAKRQGTATTSTATAIATAPTRIASAADDATSAAAQERAVARVAALGVPIYRAGGKGKYVALTFDDGPGPYTPKALETLRANKAHATFFLTGTSVERFPAELAQEKARVQAGALVLGNHSWSHPYLPGMAPDAAWRQVTDTNALITRRTGVKVSLMRPPYGAHTADLRRRVRDERMAMILWDVDSGDSQGAAWDTMLDRMKREIRPGSIVLLHENRGQTLKAINRLVPWLRKNGWTMVTVPELLALDPPSLEEVRREAAGRADGTTGTRY